MGSREWGVGKRGKRAIFNFIYCLSENIPLHDFYSADNLLHKSRLH
ncbi:MAG: hypothetical protein DSM106950_05740 [Stigonema ocellatum SAG 48.90 = DSM 106950]|nr:hypothetical protein [Stigonema ocellatum SAG 48.90 = DSM 106950]